MGFRINKGIFQFNDGKEFVNKFKIADDGNMVEVNREGEPIAAYMRIGDKATDSSKSDLIQTISSTREGDDAMPSIGYSLQHFLAKGPSNNDGHILGMTWTGNTVYGAQIWVDTDPNNKMAFRSRSNAGVWTRWNNLWHDGNFNPASYLTTSGKAADSNLLDGLDSSRFLHTTSGQFSGDWNTLTDSDYEIQLREVHNITGGSHSNHPTGLYPYGSVLGWQLANSTFKLYNSHTGDLAFQTGWNNDGYSGWRTIIHSSNIGSQSVNYASSAGNLGANYTADTWFRATSDNNTVKFYGNSRMMVFRTDGTGGDTGHTGYAFKWTYGGDGTGNTLMILDSNGEVWTKRYGWLHSRFETSGAAGTVETALNTRIDEELRPAIDTAQSTADSAVTAAAAAQATANVAETRANGAKQTAADALTVANSKQNAGNYATFSYITLNDSATTASFIAELTTEHGAFKDNYKAYKVGWSYAGNSNLDVGFESVELAGCLIECYGGTYKHVRLTRPTTGTGGRSIYVYNDQGSGYAPGWRQIWTSDEFSSTNVSNWNTAYGWGNHAGLYLGATAKAADSNLLDGLDSSGYVQTTGSQTITGTKRFSNSSIVIEGSHASISFIDNTSSADDFYLHANSNNFYVLSDRDGSNTVDGNYDAPHPMQLESDTNRAYFFGNMLNTAAYQPSSAFDASGSADAVNNRIDEEIIPAIATAQSTADGAVTSANSALTTAQTAETRANSAREAAVAAQTTADGKLGATAKAADSDLLDGISSGSFIRSDADDNVSGNTEWQDNKQIRLGNSADLRIWHDGSHNYFRNYNHGNGNIYFQGEDTAGANHALLYMFTANTRPYVSLYEDGSERFKTTSTGVEVLGEAKVSNGIRSMNSGGYGIIRGYNNDNHFIVIRGSVATGVSDLSITGGHRTTFVEHADDSNEGWYFVSKASGNYTEKARIDGLGNIYSSNIITNQANIQSITSDGTIANDKGSYLHLGGWAVSRTHASAVLVNTAYRADYATSLFDMNISRFTNNSGYITQGSVDGLREELRPQIEAAQSTADGKLGATAKAADSDKLDGYDWMQSGKSVRGSEIYADGWLRNYNSGKGLYNQATTQHFYSDSDDYWNVAGGTNQNGIRFRDEHGGTIRGYVYATNTNEIGFLDAGGSWAIKHTNDNGTRFYTDQSTLEFSVGRDTVDSSFGTVRTHSTLNGYGGYSIAGRVVFMHDHSSVSGIYNDVNNEWMTIWRLNGSTELMHNGSKKLETTSGGVTVTGTVSATAFSGNGSGLTNLPIPDQSVPVTINGAENTKLASINMNIDRGLVEFTMDNGQTFTAQMGR